MQRNDLRFFWYANNDQAKVNALKKAAVSIAVTTNKFAQGYKKTNKHICNQIIQIRENKTNSAGSKLKELLKIDKNSLPTSWAIGAKIPWSEQPISVLAGQF